MLEEEKENQAKAGVPDKKRSGRVGRFFRDTSLVSMRAFARIWLLLFSDFLSRSLGRKNRYLEKPSLPPSHFYPNDSLSRGILDVSEDYLLYTGWRNSRSQRRSVDRKGRALPWLTYPAIAFLEELDLGEMNVLEFGGGGSTAYFSRRSKNVTTVELDGLYLDSLRMLNLDNLTFFQWPSPSPPPASGEFFSYLNSLSKADASYETEENIQKVLNGASTLAELVRCADLILIDGGPRTLYAEITAKFARETAIVVIDNTDMRTLTGLADRFAKKRFIRIPFKGLGPLNAYGWETTVLVPRTFRAKALHGSP